MDRSILPILGEWLTQPGRKPLILRGARQVGKTWLVRELARRTERDLIEINFERNPEYRGYFAANDPRKVIDDLSLVLGREVHPPKSLLLLDEIQAAPWSRLADGRTAAQAAAEGRLVIAGLKGAEQSVPDAHGHVVVVVQGPLAHDLYPTAYWGRLGSVGKKNTTLNWAWREGDRDHLVYGAIDSA